MEMGRWLKVLRDILEKLGMEPVIPGLQGQWSIHYTIAAPIIACSFFHACSFCNVCIFCNVCLLYIACSFCIVCIFCNVCFVLFVSSALFVSFAINVAHQDNLTPEFMYCL